MKYVCLAYYDEHRVDALSESDLDALIEETLACNEELVNSGHLLAAETVEGARSGVIVRVRDGRLTVTESRPGETGEQLGGFFLINARDLNEAIQVASKMVQARMGYLEVRPLKELGQTWFSSWNHE